MEKYCGPRFWDWETILYTDDPDFTICFEKTILIWIPCLFLWLISPFEVYIVRKSKLYDIPFNVYNSTKLVAIIFLIALAIFDLVENCVFADICSPVIDFYSPLVKSFTFVLFFVLTLLNVKFGRRSSPALFLFSLLLLIFGAPQCRTELRFWWLGLETQGLKTTAFFFYIINYAVIILVFLMNCFADSPPRISPDQIDKNACPRKESSFLSQLFFTWFEPLVWKGYRTTLDSDNLWNLDDSISSSYIIPKFEKSRQKVTKSIKPDLNKTSKSYKEKPKPRGKKYEFNNAKKNQESIAKVLYQTFGVTFIRATLIKVFLDVFMLCNPQILSEDPMWKGYLYAILLFLCTMIQTLSLGQYQYKMNTIGLQVQTCLISVIYKKALNISSGARKNFTLGEAVNLMSVDASRFVDLFTYSFIFISTPLQVILTIFFLWKILGPSALAGFTLIIICILINAYVASKIKALQFVQMKRKDDRIKLMNEILFGIKMLKLYAWEPSFEKQASSIRNEEMNSLKKQAYLFGIGNFIWSCTSFLVYSATFATYVLLSEKNVLTPKIAFVSLALFNTLKFPLFMAPYTISNLIQSIISIKRIDEFLNLQDLNPTDVTHENTDEALIIENGTFSWNGANTPPFLNDINLKINSGCLVAIVGPVGSGKSSLISAFLGEMHKLSGTVNTRGTIAYVPQQAWIQNATLRDNITFGKPVRRTVYDKVLEACALKPDLKILPAGDSTEIGEKGINLSGGQKQRISIARAVYHQSDVYLFDDPLSAVDSHVGKHIFQEVIGPKGLLRNKTRVFVTHNLAYLSQVDLIVVMKDGSISECGLFHKLLNSSKGDFSEFLVTYLEESSQFDDDEEFLTLRNALAKKNLINNQQLRQNSVISLSPSISSIARRKSIQVSNTKIENLQKRRSSFQEFVAGQNLIEIERVETKGIKWEVYVYFFRTMGMFLSFGILVANCFLQGASFLTNICLSEWTSDPDVVTPEGTQVIDRRNFYLLVFALLGFMKCFSGFIAEITTRIGCWNSGKILHDRLLRNILRVPLSFIDTTPNGRILSRFSKDIDTVDSSLPENIRNLSCCFGDVVCTLLIVTFTTPIFAVVLIPIAVLYCFVQRFYDATSTQLKRLESISRSPIYSYFVESIVGGQSIRAYGLLEKFIKCSAEKVDHNHKSFYLYLVSNRWLSVRTEIISNLIIFFAALFAVMYRGTLSPGFVGLSVCYSLQIALVLSWTACMYSDVETGIISIEKVKEYTKVPQEAPWIVSNESVPDNWPSKGDVNFEDFKVRYREGLELVLKGITFGVTGGQKVGVVGRTGAGKSSLTLSLFRILESSNGKILIDGVDIATLGLHTVRSRLTIIPQDPVLFAGTLRMNLDPLNEYTDERVWHSLELSHLKPYVMTLSDGIAHKIIEGGENFSVGQRQQICLARALLRKTRILILDEATAAVDLETDDLIQNTIRHEFEDCTIITIAHRLNTIMDYDKILVLDNGFVAEYDSPESLLEVKNSVFYGLAEDAGIV